MYIQHGIIVSCFSQLDSSISLVAQRVVEIMGQLKERLYPGGRIPSDSVPQISSVILVDRSVDFMTPLFTQLTLEGLIDSIYGIESSKYPLWSHDDHMVENSDL